MVRRKLTLLQGLAALLLATTMQPGTSQAAPCNQAVIFPFVDHGPLPGEVLENSAWLSSDPNAADAGWTQAHLDHVYLQGWSA